MGLGRSEKTLKWASSSEQYFKEYGKFGVEIKLTRDIARQVCEKAFVENIWVLGIDCGQIIDGSKYLEDPNEGWISKFGLMSQFQKDQFEKGISNKFDIYNNNESALLSLYQTSDKFTAFVVRIKKMKTDSERLS